MQENQRSVLRFDGAKSYLDLGKRAEHKHGISHIIFAPLSNP